MTDEDIKKLIEANQEIFAAKEDLAKPLTLKEFDGFREEIKQKFSALRESIQAPAIAVDKLVKAVDDLRTGIFPEKRSDFVQGVEPVSKKLTRRRFFW